MRTLPRLVVAGTRSGVGKTTVATGLMAALARRGLAVSGHKVGPDFIDPSYHALATGRPPRNLDVVLHGPERLAGLLRHGAAGAEVAVIEGVMGLFDGRGAGTEASTAHVARLLGAPVLLVVDAAASSGSIAAEVHGFATFDPSVGVAGVVLNRVGSAGHEQLLRDALAPLGIPVVGALHRREELAAPSRHLGLVPAAERDPDARDALDALAGAVTAGLDLETVLTLARSAPSLSTAPWDPQAAVGGAVTDRPRIAVAGGRAFTFVYEEHRELLAAAGAEVVTVDPLTDEALPPATRGLYLGGGFPETYAAELSANAPLRTAVAALARSGAPVLAECGGLLYLCRELDGHALCGVLDATARFTDGLTLGYRDATTPGPSVLGPAGVSTNGHEFHRTVVEPRAGTRPAWRLRAHGRVADDGFTQRGVHASYLHAGWVGTPELARALVAAATRTGSPIAPSGPAAADGAGTGVHP